VNRDTPLWRTAPPLWTAAGVAVDRPAILRFDSDDFMERLQGVLAAGGGDLGELLVADETWREPKAGLAAGGAGDGTVRLYQPAHGRFYLVAASLVCARHFFPDKRIDAAAEHSAFFVLRQLRPATTGTAVDPDDPATYREWAWVPAGGAGAWRPAPAVGLATAEQRLPLFALAFPNGTATRRLLAGLVPVSAREQLEAGPARLPAPGDTSGDPMAAITDPRLGVLATVVGGLQALHSAAAPPPPAAELQESLFFGLIELAQFLKDHLLAVWEEASELSLAQQQLLDHLRAPNGFRLGRSWLDALKAADALGPGAVGAGTPTPATGLDAAGIAAALAAVGVERSEPLGSGRVDPAETTLFGKVAAALPAAPAAPTAPAAPAATAPAAAAAARERGFIYVARCVYERPRCPEQERLQVSRPTRPFELAPFHDPDAPFRPARIPTPVDTSLEGLRKHPKSVAVTISKQLRRQMERMEGIRLADIDDGSIPPAGSVSFGMVCQLSIPIITICALLLLMIIVGLLNIVFWWLPFFKICLPTVEAE
jgi:hypothetical protein